jgi:hypothetical protein
VRETESLSRSSSLRTTIGILLSSILSIYSSWLLWRGSSSRPSFWFVDQLVIPSNCIFRMIF